jgi:hypothetical protein
MGQFSWCCAVCDQEVMHGRHPGYQWTTDAVILWPNGDRRSGRYEDGYGVIAGVNLVDQLGGWRLVHQRCYEKVDLRLSAQALFASFKPEQHAADQGWWPGERLAVDRYGEPNLVELTKEQTYVCYECKRTWKAKWSGGACPFGCVRPKNYRDDPEALRGGWGDQREMVEPLHYLSYDFGNADGVIVCHNEYAKRPNWKLYHELKMDRDEAPPILVEPCFYFGEPQQARVTKPEEWDEMTNQREENGDPKPFVVRCSSCKSDNIEILDLTLSTPPKGD